MTKHIALIGYASGLGSADPGTQHGVQVLQKSEYLKELSSQGLSFEWEGVVKPQQNSDSKLELIAKECNELANHINNLVVANKPFLVLGGDHSCAMGTWSGAAHAKHAEGDIGLIWFDAHMDSHTFETTPTRNIHGMPLAALLGYGDRQLTSILNSHPKLKPENVCLLGTRSFEEGEAALLKKLNVRIFYMDEIQEKGFNKVFAEAIDIVSKNTIAYGLSIDLDGMDPTDAPGTGTSVPNGIHAKDLIHALQSIAGDKRLIGTEIVEFDPHRDVDRKTEKLICDLIATLFL